MITQAHRQAELAEAYVRIVAARCGLSHSVPFPDYGVDMTLHKVERLNGRLVQSGSALEIQTKSTTRAIVGDEGVKYDMQAEDYNKLCGKVSTDRILVLLVLPPEEHQWTTVSEGGLTVHGAAYWLSFKRRDKTVNRASVRVDIPRENLLTVEVLRAIMERI